MVRFPELSRDLSCSVSVQIKTGAHLNYFCSVFNMGVSFGVKLTICLHLVPGLRMCGAILPLNFYKFMSHTVANLSSLFYLDIILSLRVVLVSWKFPSRRGRRDITCVYITCCNTWTSHRQAVSRFLSPGPNFNCVTHTSRWSFYGLFACLSISCVISCDFFHSKGAHLWWCRDAENWSNKYPIRSILIQSSTVLYRDHNKSQRKTQKALCSGLCIQWIIAYM